MAAINNDLKSLAIPVSNAETRISSVEDFTNKQSKHIQNLERSITALRRDLTEQEDRNRRSNLRIFGLPEDCEKSASSVIDFLLTWNPNTLHISFNKDFGIEHAHRVPTFKPRSMSSPRPLIFKPLHHQHTEIILAQMRKIKSIQW